MAIRDLPIQILGLLTILSSVAIADLTCKKYVPINYHTNIGHVQYSSGSDDSGNVITHFPTTNLQDGHPAILTTKHSNGTTFRFQTCNSTSLGLTSHSFDGSGSHSGCPTTYIDYVRVVDASSGNCMTSKPAASSNGTLFELYPTKCDSNPKTTSQLFIASQYINYPCFPGGTTFYNAPGLYSMDSTQPYGEALLFTSWKLASDNKTVQYFKANGDFSNFNAAILMNN